MRALESAARMANSQSIPGSPSSSTHGTPQSESYEGFGNSHSHGNLGSPVHSTSGQNNAEKRVRACDSCRGLKVRCDPSESDPTGPCKRCSKAGRECVFTAPTRKRQKKADTRVAELERKIDALTASLKTGGRLPGTAGADSEHSSPRVVVRADSSIETPQWKDPIEYRRSSDGYEESASKRRRLAGDSILVNDVGQPITQRMLKENSNMNGGLSGSDDEFATDVIDKNLLTMETAEKLVLRYKEELFPNYPIVPIEPSMTAAKLRLEKPLLFLAILAASSSTMHQALNRELHNECVKKLSKKVVVKGRKSIELIQALNLISAWYFPPAHFEAINVYQFTHMAATMAMDLGLCRAKPEGRPPVGGGGALPKDFAMSVKAKALKTGMGVTQMMKQNHMQRMSESFPDPDSLDAKRTNAVCFIQCAGIAMNMKRPTLLRYSRYTGECLDALETHEEALESDKIIAALGKLFVLVEHVTDAFENSDDGALYTVAAFTRKCDHWREKLSPELQAHSSLQVVYHAVVCYVQESALRNQNLKIEEFRPPWAGVLVAEEQNPDKNMDDISIKQIESVKRLLVSARTVTDIFIAADVKWIRATPSAQYVRAVHATTLLSKVTEYLQKTDNKDIVEAFESHSSLGNVDDYISGLERAFRRASEGDRCYTSTKFLFMIQLVKRIRAWKKAEHSEGRKQCLKCAARAKPGDFCVNCPPAPEKPQDATMPCGLKLSEHINSDINIPGGPTPNCNLKHPAPATPSPATVATPLEMLSNAATSSNGYNDSSRYYTDDNSSTPAIPTPQSQDTQGTGPSPSFSAGMSTSSMHHPGYAGNMETDPFGQWDGYEFATGALDPMSIDWDGSNHFASMMMMTEDADGFMH